MRDEGPVLLVEHDAATRELVADVLRREDHRVVAVASGEEAWAAAQVRPPILLITSIILPGIDGWEIIRRFRDDDELAATPILVLSIAPPSPAERDRVDGYIVKPFHTSAVRQTVFDLLNPKGVAP